MGPISKLHVTKSNIDVPLMAPWKCWFKRQVGPWFHKLDCLGWLYLSFWWGYAIFRGWPARFCLKVFVLHTTGDAHTNFDDIVSSPGSDGIRSSRLVAVHFKLFPVEGCSVAACARWHTGNVVTPRSRALNRTNISNLAIVKFFVLRRLTKWASMSGSPILHVECVEHFSGENTFEACLREWRFIRHYFW